MRKPAALTVLVAFVVSLLLYCLLGGEASVWGSFKDPETEKLLKQFVALKEKQVATDPDGGSPSTVAYFKSAKLGQWLSFSNSLCQLSRWRVRHRGYYGAPPRPENFSESFEDYTEALAYKMGWHFQFSGPPELKGRDNEVVNEIYGAFNAFLTGDEKYTAEFGRDIIDSIPPGSVYFGGTEPGRYIVTAMCKSQPEGDPFFVFTQHSLQDGTYLDYLRSMYGHKVYIPTPEDSNACFQKYAHSKMMVSTNDTDEDFGQPDVMGVNSLVSRLIFDKCPTNEFFIEESYPLNWMRPYLEPHGLIFKINRHPLVEMSAGIVQRDHEYWRKSLAPKIGGWLTEKTTVQTVAAFAKKTFSQRDFNGFAGDPQFVQNDYTCKLFSRERAAIADLYSWRANHAKDDSEKKQMAGEADFAFRQAWALCPYASEATFRYINFLLKQNRSDDALLVAETMTALPQVKDDEYLKGLPAQIKQFQKDHPPSASAN